MRNELFRLVNACKKSSADKGLSGLSFHIFESEIVGITGLSGSGIAHLPGLFSGNAALDSGAFFVQDRQVSLASPHQAQKAGVFYIQPDTSLVPGLSVAENFSVVRPQSTLLVHRKRITAGVQAICRRYGVDVDARQKVKTLSRMQQQRVEILKAVFNGARLIVLNTLYSALSPQETDEVHALIRALRDDGISFLFICEHVEYDVDILDRLIILRAGRKAGTFYKHGMSEQDIVHLLTGETPKASDANGRAPRATAAGPLFRLRDVAIPPHVAGMDLDINRGEAIGIVEASGQFSGALQQYLERCPRHEGSRAGTKPRQGIPLIDGRNLLGNLYPKLTVAENLLVDAWGQYTQAGVIDRRFARYAVEEYAARYGIAAEALWEPLWGMPMEIQLKASLYRHIVARRAALVFENTYVGADILMRKQIADFIQDAKSEGFAILYCSPVLSGWSSFCDRLYAVQGGGLHAIAQP